MRYITKLVPRSIRNRILEFLRRRIHPVFVSNTYSQCGEDRIFNFLFRELGMGNPRYLDIGACHPSRGNNTYLFYLNGATGVCVEPNPEMAALIIEKRPRDLVLNVAITPSEHDTMTYYMFEDAQLNTLVREEALSRSISGKNPIKNEIQVPTVTINTILRDHFSQGLDLLSLDAEGMDYTILSSVDFECYRPLIICVETVGYSEGPGRAKGSDAIVLLEEKGYRKYADTHVNTIFIDNQAPVVKQIN